MLDLLGNAVPKFGKRKKPYDWTKAEIKIFMISRNGKCWGLTRNINFCLREGDRCFCKEHRKQPLHWAYITITILASLMAITKYKSEVPSIETSLAPENGAMHSLIDARLRAMHEEISRLNKSAEIETDTYGLTKLRIGDAYRKMPEADNYFTALRLYRESMLEGDRESEKRVYESYVELVEAVYEKENQAVDMAFIMDENNIIRRFEFGPTPITISHDFSAEWAAGKSIRTAVCIDVFKDLEETRRTCPQALGF